jgi:hypothetical protein
MDACKYEKKGKILSSGVTNQIVYYFSFFFVSSVLLIVCLFVWFIHEHVWNMRFLGVNDSQYLHLEQYNFIFLNNDFNIIFRILFHTRRIHSQLHRFSYAIMKDIPLVFIIMRFLGIKYFFIVYNYLFVLLFYY